MYETRTYGADPNWLNPINFTKDRLIQFFVKEKEKVQLKEASNFLSISLAGFVRSTVLQKARRILKNSEVIANV